MFRPWNKTDLQVKAWLSTLRRRNVGALSVLTPLVVHLPAKDRA